MAIIKRFSYSLLISTLIFAAFTVVAFSGLFPWIEAQFYSPKVVAEFQNRLGQTAQMVELWKKTSLDRLDKVLSDRSFDGVFSPTSSATALQKRYQIAKLFLMGVRGTSSLRILNGDRSQVHFSTEDSDVKVRGDTSLTYRPVAELSGLPDLKGGGLDDGAAHLLSSGTPGALWLLRPWKDSQGLLPGFALMQVSIEDLRLSLVEAGVGLASQPITSLSDDEYLFSLLGRAVDRPLLERVRDLLGRGVVPPVQRIAQVDGQLTVILVHHGSLNLLAPASSLELDPGLKALLLVSLYTVVFLIVFLVANLRGEPVSVVTRKVKRFQLQVFRQYLDLKETEKIKSLRDELASHSDEIRLDLRRSIGPVRRRDREWVDRYIDTSWQEVMDLLRGPAPPPETSSNADWKRLETLLQQALTQGRFVVSEGGGSGAAQLKPAPQKVSREVVEDVEELDEVEELEPEAEELEPVEELHEVGDGDEVEELEEVGDAEEVEELEEVSDAEELEELEEVGEAEEAEQLEEVGDAEELDDVEELEEASTDDEIVPVAVEELPPSLPVSSLYRTQGVGRIAQTVTTLVAEGESPEAADDVEELDELEEIIEELPEDTTVGDQSFSLERLDAAWTSASAGVFEESGDVVTLKEEVFDFVDTRHDEFGQLVNEVLAGSEVLPFTPLDEEGLVPSHLIREWRWTGAGFDWDRYAQSRDEVGLFRALSEIVSEFDAFTATIMVEENGRWVGQSSVGFSDSGKGALNFGPEAPLSKGFLGIRALHVLNGGPDHPALRDAFHKKELKFLKSVLCVPLLYSHEPAWLLLGLRHEPGNVLELLAPRRTT